MKWPDFAASFRALVHDIAQSDYQRMALLRSYLTPSVRSSITQLLSDPIQYWEVLRSLKKTYSHPILVGNAYLITMTKLPVVRPENLGSLQRFVNQLTEAIRGLKITVNAKEINYTALLQMILAKLPKSICSECGRRVLKLNRQLDLRDIRDWLLRKIMANRIVDEVAQTPDRTQETKSGFHSRRVISTVQKVAENPITEHVISLSGNIF